MTAYATRSPLQLLSNTHIMSESRRSTRRTSARLADKEDIPITNGIGHTTDNRKGGQTNGASVKQGKTNVNGPGTAVGGARSKRKYGECTLSRFLKYRNCGAPGLTTKLI